MKAGASSSAQLKPLTGEQDNAVGCRLDVSISAGVLTTRVFSSQMHDGWAAAALMMPTVELATTTN